MNPAIRWRLDPVAFLQASGHPWPVDLWQARLARDTAPRIALAAARQVGKSTTTSRIALRRAILTPKTLVLIAATGLMAASELMRKLRDGLAALRARGVEITAVRERELSLEFANGSRVVCVPGVERSVRSFSNVALLLVDEAARVPDALFDALSPMMAACPTAQWIMLSSVWDELGYFYQACTSAAAEWSLYVVPVTQVARYSQSFLASERARMSERVYRREYLCEFAAAGGSQLFTREALEQTVTMGAMMIPFPAHLPRQRFVGDVA